MAVDERKNYWYWRDEILRVMYWLNSQGFRKEVGWSDLLQWLNEDETMLKPHVEQLAKEGYLEENRLKLTQRGYLEAKKRFVDEFQPVHYSHDHSDCPPEAPCHEE